MIDPAQFKLPISGSWLCGHMRLRAHPLLELALLLNVLLFIKASLLAERPASKVQMETDYAA
jgi:hypothetical protein